jgi:hypothetical protein
MFLARSIQEVVCQDNDRTRSLTMTQLTERESYQAMIYFLEKYYELTNSSDVGALLGSMQLLEDGASADPALWSDWLGAIQRVQRRS